MFKQRQYFRLHQAFHFKRNAGQGNGNFAVFFKPHAAGRTAPVAQHPAAFGQISLGFVVGVYFPAAGQEHFLQPGIYLRVKFQRGGEKIRQGFFG